MQTNANTETRASIKRRLMRFSRTVSVNDMRPEESTRRHRAAKFERKNKTSGKRSQFLPAVMPWELH